MHSVRHRVTASPLFRPGIGRAAAEETPMTDYPRFPGDDLTRFARACLEWAGIPPEDAAPHVGGSRRMFLY